MRRLALFTILALIAACGAGDDEAADARQEYTLQTELIPMPAPEINGDTSLEAAIEQRRSTREYTDQPLSHAEISQLLWAAQGTTSAQGQRAAPSAGGLYPLEVYVAMPKGSFHYVPGQHALVQLGDKDLRRALSSVALGQEAVRDGAAVFVVTAVFARTEQKYGDRAERYAILEAGHAAQNLLLQATALDLSAVPIGAFNDADVQAVLGLPADHEPLYLIPVGH